MTNTTQSISTRKPMFPTPDEMAAAQAVWDAVVAVRKVASLSDTGRVAELESTLATMLQTFTGFGSVVWEVMDQLRDDPGMCLDSAVVYAVEHF